MTNLVVTITQAHVVNPQVGLTVESTRLQIERQQQIATVVESAAAGLLTLQGEQPYATTVLPGEEGVVTIRFDSTYQANLVAGDAAVAIFGGSIIADIRQTFETINRNLKTRPGVLNYDSTGLLDSIDYDLGAGRAIHKQFTYAQSVLTTITLSGDVPGGVNLVKNLIYGSGRLSEFTYS
jgi:hypothetical protein